MERQKKKKKKKSTGRYMHVYKTDSILKGVAMTCYSMKLNRQNACPVQLTTRVCVLYLVAKCTHITTCVSN